MNFLDTTDANVYYRVGSTTTTTSHHRSSAAAQGSSSNKISGNNSNSSNIGGYVSPIAAINHEIRRKNGAAAASAFHAAGTSTTTTAAGYCSTTASDDDPWAAEQDADLLGGDHEEAQQRSSSHQLLRTEQCTCRSARRRTLSGWASARSGNKNLAGTSEQDQTNDNNIAAAKDTCPRCGKDIPMHDQSTSTSSFAWSNQPGNSTVSRTHRDGLGLATSSSTPRSPHHHRPSLHHHHPHRASSFYRHNAGKASFLPEPNHAEALLQSTPQLRFLSPASTDLQGGGNSANSNNFLLFAFQAAVETTAGTKKPGGGGSVGGGGGGGSKTDAATTAATTATGSQQEYRASLIRDRANAAAAAELASLLSVLAHEMSLEEYGTVEAQVFTAVFALVHSSVKNNNSSSNNNNNTGNSSANMTGEMCKERRMAGLAALDALLAAPSADEERKAIKFANTLSNSLRAVRDFEFLSAVARALGHMAKRTANVDFVESEVTRALEWLRTERSDRRLAACLSLREFAKELPTTFHSKTSHSTLGQGGSNEFLDNIFQAIRDPQPIVRACATDALSQCLKILVERHHPSLTGLLCQVHFNVMDGLMEDTTKKRPWHTIPAVEAAQHGSLLVVASMIAYTRDFMLPRFEEVCRAVLKFTNHPKALIRLEVVRLIPRLACRCPDVFGRRYLEDSLLFLMHSAATPPGPRVGVDLRPSAYTALGQLILAMTDETTGQVIGGSNLPTIKIIDEPAAEGNGQIVEMRESGIIYEKLAQIFDLVRAGLRHSPSNKGTESRIVKPALHCAASLVEALEDLALPYISDLIDDMFRAGLSHDLIQCLQSIAECVPAQQNDIEDRMLQGVSICLAGTSNVFDPLASFKSSVLLARMGQYFGSAQDSMREYAMADAGTELPSVTINMLEDPETIRALVLGLETLSSFGGATGRVASKGGGMVPLLPFVQDVVAKYLSHPAEEVRKAAALTCCALLVPHGSPQKNHVGSYSGLIVEDVLERLLRAAVSDPSVAVRLCVVRALDSRYEKFLCQSHHLQELFLLLQDEALAIRAAGLQLLGRLASINPGPILPALRRLLNEMIVELECGVDTGRVREEATRLIVVFLRAKPLQRLIRPVLPTLVNALPLDKAAPPRLASAALEALGELALAVGKDLQPWVKEVMPHVLEMMNDRSSASKQRTSLRTLGQIAGSTEYVIRPYLDYPGLLSQATDILPATKRAPWSLRREVIRTLGIVGALDPDRFHELGSKTRKDGAVGGAYFEVDSSESLNKSAPSTAMRIPAPGTSEPGNKKIPDNGLSLVGDTDDDEPASIFMYEQYAMAAQPVSSLPPAKRMSPTDEEFFPTVAIQALMRIFRDPSLAVHHGMVAQAVMFIFKSLGLRCVPYLNKVVPHMIYAVRTCGPSNLRESLLKQLATLSVIVREHLRPYVADIFDVVELFWSSRHLATIFSLISNLAVGCPDEFKRFVPRLIRRLLSTFDELQVADWSSLDSLTVLGRGQDESEKLRLILRSVCSLKVVLVDYLRIIIPALLKLADSLATLSLNDDTRLPESVLVELSVQVFRTIASLLDSLSVTSGNVVMPYMTDDWPLSRQSSENGLPSRVVQPLVRILRNKRPKSPAVGMSIVETLCVCLRQIGGPAWVQLYDDVVRGAISGWQASFPIATGTEMPSTSFHVDDRIVSCLDLYDEAVEDAMLPPTERTYSANPRGLSFHGGISQEFTQFDIGDLPGAGVSRPKVNQGKLQRSWDVSQRSSRDDWEEWMRRLGIQLLREAPSPALRATASLAQAYQPLARELFSAAFACCWNELSEPYRVNLVHALKTAFVADVSPEILQALLNLAEFMEHDPSGGLPIEIPILADLALKCRAYAKALHYKEREYNLGGSNACVEQLININGKLDLPEAALGVLRASSLGEYDDNSEPLGEDRLTEVYKHQACEMYYSVIWNTDERVVNKSRPVDLSAREELWLAKLGAWSEALAVYQEKLKRDPNDTEAMVGCMQCLIANGEWQKVLDLADDQWIEKGTESKFEPNDDSDSRLQRKAVRMCAQAAWRLGRWGDLENFASQLVGQGDEKVASPTSPTSPDGSIRIIDFEGAFYSAVLHVHRKEWANAANAIDAARRAMDGRLTALMAESYGRSYPSMVTAQCLAEMEEIVEFRKTEERAAASTLRHSVNRPNDIAARKSLLSVWRKRLAGCRVDAEVHASILAVRSLVLGPTDEVEATLKLSELSRQSQRDKFAERVLLAPLEALHADLNGPCFGFNLSEQLRIRLDFSAVASSSIPVIIDRVVAGDLAAILPRYGQSHDQWSKSLVNEAGGLEKLTIQYQLYFSFLRHLWYTDRREEAMLRLSNLCDVVDMVYHCENISDTSLRVGCWLELGEWKLRLAESPESSHISEPLQADVLTAFKRATLLDDCGYRAFHAWALVNFRIAIQISEDVDDLDQASNQTLKTVRSHVVAAVKGFVNAISQGTKKWCASVQQDLLNLLTCLFRFGNVQDVAAVINDAIGAIAIEAWLGVLPQLLARIHIKDPSIRAVLHPLLTRLGEKHPQALMYPLSVLMKSPVAERKHSAESLMNSLKNHSSELVGEALMVSSELIRVAILWLETWHEGLEDASRLWFGEGNVAAMLDLLLPLHEIIENGPETSRETEFLDSFGADLEKAHLHIKDYIMHIRESGSTIPTGNQPTVPQNEEAETAMNKAWDIYYTVFRRINKQLPSLTKLELAQCSPALSRAKSLELGVPGTYRVDGSYVNIEKFIPSVEVITSKQRPRKITLRGSDGKDYVFLLKGHEDLRQDERVMQLFGLVNALLVRDPQTRKHDLKIQRYAISPLSHNCGVVGWVPHCDTFHSLIRDYRTSKKIPLNMENREMLKIAPDYDILTVMQKVEVFIQALKQTTGKGDDLYEVIWLKSANSEEWLERRTKFTRSLAVMSMVGYILGLGDRHPSNLMLDKISGRVLHIDFGDCFEVAMNRDKFPEKVPFRLTRMLIRAMEVSGIEGSYRSTCEKTMNVLRDSRDSLVAMLEAFVYDPLISWRLADLSQSNLSGELSGVPVPVDAMRQRSPCVEPERPNFAMGTSIRTPLVNPITEGVESDEGEGQVDPLPVRIFEQIPSVPTRQITASSANDANQRARSLQMYADIQNWAADLNTNSRIASVTGTKSAAVESSLAHSRLERSMKQREFMSLLGGEEGAAHEEALNEKALKVIRRVEDKLSGTDFHDSAGEPLDVSDQVQRLIVQATSSENLCQLFIGWCSFW